MEAVSVAVAGVVHKRRRLPSPCLRRNLLATDSEGVLQCTQFFDENNIDNRNCVCPFCSALRWPDEGDSRCCYDGKVRLPSFPEGPPFLKRLFNNQDARSETFRKFIRPINNMLSMASIKLGEGPVTSSFQPTVFIHVRLPFSPSLAILTVIFVALQGKS